MKQWEYKTLSITKTLKKMIAVGRYNLDSKLDELGSEGWELVAVDPTGNVGTYLFKRPYYDDEAEDYDDETSDGGEDYEEDEPEQDDDDASYSDEGDDDEWEADGDEKDDEGDSDEWEADGSPKWI